MTNHSDDRPERGLLRQLSASAGSWALVLGATGFVAGFFGPITFSPDANQGPLLGLLITGPGGALLGALLGFVVRVARVPTAIAAKALIASAVALAVVCLYYSMPSPRYHANVVEVQIADCALPGSMKVKAFEYWDRRVAKVTWAPPRAGWKEDFERMVRAEPGVVLEVRVLRSRKLFENRKPWNSGTFFASPWAGDDAPTHYFARFAGDSCARYPAGEQAVYLTTGESSKLWPAETLSVFLNLQLAEPLPDQFTDIVAR